MKRFALSALLLACSALLPTSLFAGSATWAGEPPYENYWYKADYWQPNTVPENPGDVATFGASGTTNCKVSYFSIDIDSIVFTPDAQAYSIISDTTGFSLSGQGIVNNSSLMQNFTIEPYGYYDRLQNITFLNQASAGDLVHYTTVGTYPDDGYGGALIFQDQSNAGTAVITNQATADAYYGGVNFYNSSSAQGASITNEAATDNDHGGAETWFFDDSTASSAYIVNQGGLTEGGSGEVIFEDFATAGNSTIISEASADGDSDWASIWFENNSDGGSSRIILYGDGTLYTYYRALDTYPGVINIGSLEGDGHVKIAGYSFGQMTLTVGSNNLNTKFDGLLEELSYEKGAEGSIKKIGSGRLILTNANSYHGSTTVEAGTLLVNNGINGSGTGSGNVFVTGGTFGGDGTVAGRVFVGTGSGAGAYLAPGKSGVKPGTLTIQKRLILEADATYKVTLDSRTAATDKVTCLGASIRSASILFNDVGASVIPVGTVFTVLDNTASVETVGTFRNLPDGATVTVGSNTFLANYEGGDGNDLTLTVVP